MQENIFTYVLIMPVPARIAKDRLCGSGLYFHKFKVSVKHGVFLSVPEEDVKPAEESPRAAKRRGERKGEVKAADTSTEKK